jgi:4-hydroxy-2-oxoglutarate aldolase
MLLDGLQLPLTTPFYPDGRLNLLKLEHNVARYSKTPAAGLVALSEFGEPTLLSEEETRRVLKAVIGAAAPEKVLIAGVSRDSVSGTLEVAETAAGFGYDAVLVRRPGILWSGGREWTKELITYFQAVADRSALPLLLESGISAERGMLPVDVLIELAGHPGVIGVLEGACGDGRVEAIKAGTAQVRREVRVTNVFAAMTGRMGSREGDGEGGGLISAASLTGGTAVANAKPKSVVATRKKVVGFQILAGRTDELLRGLRAGATGIKFGCDLNGYFGGGPRLPFLPLTGAERAEVEDLMQGMRN